MSETSAADQNVRLYPWYAAFYNAFFWMPVFFLYFGDHLDLTGVLYLEAVYYTAIVFLEVPSGYVSDSLGRRPTLITSSVLLVIAYATFVIGGSFAVFAIAQVCLAAGIAFQSGTGTSFLYDSLSDAGREDDYEAKEATVARTSLGATAAAAVLGGLAGAWDLRMAYVLSGLGGLAALFVTLQFTEPTRSDDAPGEQRHFGGQLLDCFGYLRQPALLWFFGYAVAMTVLNHLPYEFYQPYIELLGADLGWHTGTPAATGLHMGVTTLLGAYVAGKSAEWSQRFGRRRVLLSATALQGLVLAAMALVLHPLIALVILLRGVPGAMAKAPLRAGVTPHVDRGHRATYLSLQSLAGRLGFAATLSVLGAMVSGAPAESWQALSTVLQWSGMIAAAAFVILAVISPMTRRG